MAGILSHFSDVRLAEVYRYTLLEVICDARAETASPPASPLRMQRLFRLPYRLIEAVTDFNRQHSAACIEKLTAIPAAGCSDPWDPVGERQLEERVSAIMRSITCLITEAWKMPPRDTAILADLAAAELRQWIREEYESGRDTHAEAIDTLRRSQAPTATRAAIPTPKRRQNNRKIPIDRFLGILETKVRSRLRREFPAPETLRGKMVDEIYGLSAVDLAPQVNAELRSLGVEPVSPKTISRSEKYKNWKQYRRHAVLPAERATDCGPAFNKPGYQTPTVSDTAEVALKAEGLVERCGRRLQSGGRGRTELDRKADEWAKQAGAVLPPAD